MVPTLKRERDASDEHERCLPGSHFAGTAEIFHFATGTGETAVTRQSALLEVSLTS
jgi:hypothetical protein